MVLCSTLLVGAVLLCVVLGGLVLSDLSERCCAVECSTVLFAVVLLSTMQVFLVLCCVIVELLLVCFMLLLGMCIWDTLGQSLPKVM